MFKESQEGQTHFVCEDRKAADGCCCCSNHQCKPIATSGYYVGTSSYIGTTKNRHPLEWFTHRIGQKIRRLTDTKCCGQCDWILKNGLIIHDQAHAEYLYNVQLEMGLEYDDYGQST